MPILPMHRHKIPRPRQVQHQLQLLLAGVPMHMHRRYPVVKHPRPLPQQVVNRLAHRALIPRYRRRRNNHRVPLNQLHIPTLPIGNPHQRRRRLPLAPRGHQRHPLRRPLPRFPHRNNRAGQRRQIPHLSRHIHIRHHTAPHKCHLAPVLLRRADYLLNPADERRKSSDDNPPRRIPDRPIQRRPHRLLRRRIARQLRISRIRTKQQHALRPPFRQRRQVNGMPVHRSMVNLEIPRMNDATPGRVNANPHRIRDAVAHPKPGRPEALPKLNRLLRLHHMDVRRRVPCPPPLVQLDRNQPMRQPRRIHRNIQLRQHIRQRANMVLVAVRNQYPPHPLRPRRQIRNIRDNQVNARHILSRKLNAAVNNDNVVAALQRHHILADLAQTAQRQNPQR